ncbi:hypothetical protein BC936DRAFT_142459 [Jimgerdemannia flammicorona]|uniref:Uncharacterized protein n=1 Tax=Jimgerdemannia flammicorona TaxID=994334 RepID=A0A433A0D0_9FUNG|nr:hypothetical protein BC936DRAFT_142459 [Jimgerdemannia flammicorona]
MQIKGNTFIVTGGASGLGEATARELIRQGANVAVGATNFMPLKIHCVLTINPAVTSPDVPIQIFDLNEEKAVSVVKILGPNAFTPGTVDVTSEEIVKSAIAATVARFGKLAGVVNCGGVATAAKVRFFFFFSSPRNLLDNALIFRIPMHSRPPSRESPWGL